jgi:hypothetical protein
MTVLVTLPIHSLLATYSIEVYLSDDKHLRIRSTIDGLPVSYSQDYKAAIQGLLAVILGHYLSKIDIESDKYDEGVFIALREIERQYLPNERDYSNLAPSLKLDVKNQSANESVSHPLAKLAGKFSTSEWSETWKEIDNIHQQLNHPQNQPGC